MGKPTGFLENRRHLPLLRAREERVGDFHEVSANLDDGAARTEASRCMDCGVPFCTWACPLGNVAPDFNDLVYRGRWREALERLHSTNGFPELTGLVCPAPCEAACVLGLSDDPVSIRQLEWEIVRHGFESGWVVPRPARRRTGQRVAIVGSGPAGLSAAQELARAGHDVTVFEKSDRVGGLLRYGIPDFKLEKWILDRRLEQLVAEGVELVTGVEVGVGVTPSELVHGFDAVLLAMGCGVPRDLELPGRPLAGVHFALEYLTQQNRRCAGDGEPSEGVLHAADKDVVVLGGGDTGSDCVGTALRQGARSVTSLEVQERPPDARDPSTPWPRWPLLFRTSSSHDEGGERVYAVLTKRLSGDSGRLRKLHAVRVAWERDASGRRSLNEIPGTEHEIPCDLLLLALGFVHPVRDGLLADLGVALDERGNVSAPSGFETSVPGVFAAGDVRRGQSLVVWAIAEGRNAARAIDGYLAAGSRRGRAVAARRASV